MLIRDKSSLSVVPLGGVGNQLFSLAAGLQQARRLEVPLQAVEVGQTSSLRQLVEWLAEPDVNVVESSNLSVKLKRMMSRVDLDRKRWFAEKDFGYDAEVWEVSPGCSMFGYFQSPKYFPNVEETITTRILFGGPRVSDAAEGRLVVHVRRGDYLKPAALAKHGLAGQDYFAEALSRTPFQAKRNNTKVFTDSPDLIPSVLQPFAQSEFNGQSSVSAALSTLAEMAQADTLILSNSTLSWWAARAARKRNPECKIIVPDPWFRDGTSSRDLIPEDWIRLPA